MFVPLIGRYYSTGNVLDYNFKNIQYRYFTSDAIIETETGTYTDRNAPIKSKSITWNHGIGEVVNSLITNGLVINSLNEYDYSPYNCFNKTVEISENKFGIKHLKNKIPMIYSIVATK